MIQRIQKWKKQDGFTLVEIIVVLVILAILAAFTIPAMLGFVNEARGKAYIAEAREVYIAYQSAVSEVGGSGNAVLDSYKGTVNADGTSITGTPAATADQVQKKGIAYLKTSENATDLTKDAEYTVTVDIVNKTVSKVVYVAGGYRITIDQTASGSGTAIVEKV